MRLHKFTRANDFIGLSAVLRTFRVFAAAPSRNAVGHRRQRRRRDLPRNPKVARRLRPSLPPVWRVAPWSRHNKKCRGIISRGETKRFAVRAVSHWNHYERRIDDFAELFVFKDLTAFSLRAFPWGCHRAEKSSVRDGGSLRVLRFRL